MTPLEECIKKLKDKGYSASYVNSFTRLFDHLVADNSPFIRETDVEAVKDIPRYEDLETTPEETKTALQKTVVIKLNGGLGTTMGLDKAKSLLTVKSNPDGDKTFLDIIIQGLQHLRKTTGAKLPLVFMNSFRTSTDTKSFLEKNYPEVLAQAKTEGVNWEFLQHSEPKLDAETFAPIHYPPNPDLEWCPPGHGDFYSSLFDSGLLQQLVDAGYRYAFVSNADNLGARVDPKIAAHFAEVVDENDALMMLELANKTDLDIKGGHIVRDKSTRRLLLREVAQIAEEDLDTAFNKEVHPYFNTNSIWLNLPKLLVEMEKTEGVVELPLIVNRKTVDPTDKTSPKIIQLESAIGAAIGSFDDTAVLNIPRSRFLPVKTNSDLERLRSAEFILTEDSRLVAADSVVARGGEEAAGK